MQPWILRRMPWFVRQFDECIALLGGDPPNLADMFVVVERLRLRVGERDDLDGHSPAFSKIQ